MLPLAPLGHIPLLSTQLVLRKVQVSLIYNDIVTQGCPRRLAPIGNDGVGVASYIAERESTMSVQNCSEWSELLRQTA